VLPVHAHRWTRYIDDIAVAGHENHLAGLHPSAWAVMQALFMIEKYIDNHE
jgi:hypothetical protein